MVFVVSAVLLCILNSGTSYFLIALYQMQIVSKFGPQLFKVLRGVHF